MRVTRNWWFEPEEDAAYAMALGNFDGVHTGHQMLLRDMVNLAGQQGLICGVWSFENHTLSVLTGEAPAQLTTDRERLALFEQCGMTCLALPHFTREVAAMSPRDFVRRLLQPGNIRLLTVGYDYKFGAERAGDAEILRQLAADYGCTVHIVAPYTMDGQTVSASAIRHALTTGALSRANAMLGRCYAISGIVSKGKQNGRTIGFPTANLTVDDQRKLLPQNGVYATEVTVFGTSYPAVTNIGQNPTVGQDLPVTIESHALGLDTDVYGQEMTVKFIRYLRGERRFESLPALRAQIAQDIEQAISGTGREEHNVYRSG